VARTGILERSALARLGRLRIGRHHVTPVLVIAIPHHERHGTAQGLRVADSGEDLDRVGLDLHPATAAVASLPAPEIGIDRSAIDRHSCRQPFDDHRERRAVGFTGCQET
jgi:hypothetical protein